MSWLVVPVLALVAACGGRWRFEPQDAGPDTTLVADDDATSCAFTFCDDFNRPDGSGNGPWDNLSLTNGGQGAVVNGQFVTTVPVTGDIAYLVEALPAPTTSVTVSMKMGYATADPGTNCELDLVALNWASGTCVTPFGFYLVRDGTNPFNLQETNGNATCTNNRNNYYSVWENTGLHDVKLTVNLGAANVATVVIELDGIAQPTITTVQPVPSAPLTLKLGGGGGRNLAAAWTITYDDLIVDVQ